MRAEFASWRGVPTVSQKAALEAWGETPKPHILCFGVNIREGRLFCDLIVQITRVRKGKKSLTLHFPDGKRRRVLVLWDNPSRAGAYGEAHFKVLED